ncbi:MAG: GAF domain-containing SpoIIE family protein phosphatase [Bacteroidota bacterium]
MPVLPSGQSIRQALTSPRGTRGQRVLMAILVGVCYVLGFVYHFVLWQTGQPAAPVLEWAYHAVVAIGFGMAWYLLYQYIRVRYGSPAKVFWTTLLLGIFLLGIASLMSNVGAPVSGALVGSAAPGIDIYLNVPLSLLTVVKANLISLGTVAFGLLLLIQFRQLVLFKRSKSSQRNWYLMLGLILFTSLTALWVEPGAAKIILFLPAVVLITINAFRLSWIVYLSFKEKMVVSGLSLLLFLMLLVGFVGLVSDDVVMAGSLLSYYSPMLHTFSVLAYLFGILYCATSLLSLIFHLPTTTDFQRKAGELAAMQSLTRLVSQVFDAETLYSTITSSPIEASLANTAWLVIPEVRDGAIRSRIVAATNTTPAFLNEVLDAKALYDEVSSSRETLHLAQAPADHRVAARPGDGIGSLIGIPLIARDRPMGVLFASKEVSMGFEDDDIDALKVFAAQASIALDNAHLFKEQLDKERLSRELDIAREVQQKLLPQALPPVDGATVAASSVSAQEVGGDYYDVAQVDAQRTAFIVGDVSGKGTSAAFYMAELQGIFHAVSRLAPSPVDFLSEANRALSGSLDRNVFISVVYGLLDVEKEELVLARAGHCPVATINLQGEARFVRSRGMGLGLDRGQLFRHALAEERIPLQPGDVFVLYTDGIVESRNAADEEYGYDRLLAALKEHRHEDAADLHRALIDDLQRFTGHDYYDDDMTLLVLKWHGINLAGSLHSVAAVPDGETHESVALSELALPAE